ncbi:MAG: hypothetical protein JWM53_4600 [bacterium]|nr:hypothetical protein [bacterium]
MRLLLPLLLVAGCGSGSSNATDMQSGAALDLAVAACTRTLDGDCATQATGYCVRTLAAAQMPSTWCPDGGTQATATLQHCAGGQTLIVVAYTDSSDHFVYDASGALIAIFTALPHQPATCAGGPGSFPAPSGCDAATSICS